MIATDRFDSLSKLKKVPMGKRLLAFLFARVARAVNSERAGNVETSVISSGEIIPLLGSPLPNTNPCGSLDSEDVAPVVDFQRRLRERYLTLNTSMSQVCLEAISNRVVLSGLLEQVALTTRAYALFFEKQEKGTLLLLTGLSPREKIVAQVARSLGWPVRYSFFGRFFAPLYAIRRIRCRDCDGLPPVGKIASAYSNSALATLHGGVKGSIAFYCNDERHIRRLRETMLEVYRDGEPVSLLTMNTQRAAEELNGTELEIIPISHCLPAPVAREEPETIYRSSMKDWKRLFADSTTLPGTYRGISLAAYCEENFGSIWAKLSVESCLFERSASVFLDSRRPRLVVLSNNGLHSTIIAGLCAARGIRVVSDILASQPAGGDSVKNMVDKIRKNSAS